jgi:hypothetical protein
MEWRAGMESLSPSTINVRLSAVRKMVGEARRAGMIGQEKEANRDTKHEELWFGFDALLDVADSLMKDLPDQAA